MTQSGEFDQLNAGKLMGDEKGVPDLGAVCETLEVTFKTRVKWQVRPSSRVYMLYPFEQIRFVRLGAHRDACCGHKFDLMHP